MSREFRELVLALCVALLGVIAVVFQFPLLLRAVIVLPLVLIVPGYVWSVVLLKGRENSLLVFCTYVFGLDMCLLLLTGLILNLTVGLTTLSWVMALGLLSGLGVLAVMLRGSVSFVFGLGACLLLLTGLILNLTVGLPRLSWVTALGLLSGLCALAVLLRDSRVPAASQQIRRKWLTPWLMGLLPVMLLTLLYSRESAARAQADASFTQLWALAQRGGSVHIGVRSFEHTEMRVRLVVAGHTVGQQLLAPGQQWNLTLSEPRGTAITLYRNQESRAFREVVVGDPP